MGKVAALALALAVAGCAGNAIQDSLVFCDAAKPIRPAPGETAKMSDRLVDQIHQHNALGSQACGWKP